jgi:hypothetical protein
MTQLELDLGDKFQMWDKIARDMVERASYSSGTSVKVYGEYKDPYVFWLGTRTFVYDTDHEYIHKIDFETAKYLIENVPGVSEWFDCVTKRIIGY